MVTDASKNAVGGVLEQELDKGWKPLAFYSKSLAKASKNHATFAKELLEIFGNIYVVLQKV